MQLTFENKTIDQVAIELIQAVAGNNTLYATVSGGKDSTVEVDLVRRSGCPYELHYHRTGLDAPETVRFIREAYPEVTFDMPKRTFWDGVMSKGLPLRQQRWCCAELKECFGSGIIVDGVRRQESNSRKHRNCFEPSYSREGSFFLHPIFKWSTNDVWQYIDERKLPHNPLYYNGTKRIPNRRIGCLLCPNNSKRETQRQMTRWPGFTRLYRIYADRYVQARIDRGTPLTQKTGEEYFNWWIHR